MAFGIFSKNRNTKENDDSGKVAYLFKRIRLNVNQPSGKTINRDFGSEPNFGQVNENYASFGAHDNRASTQTFAQTQNGQNPAFNPDEQYSSAFSDPGFTNIAPENLQSPLNTDNPSDFINSNIQSDTSKSASLHQPLHQTPLQDDEPHYAIGPSERELKRNDYYTYKANEAYLNEEGRDSGHLYIAPGEPLTPRKPKAEIKVEETKTPVQTDLFSSNTMVQGDISANLAKSAQNSVNAASVKTNSEKNQTPAQNYATSAKNWSADNSLFNNKNSNTQQQASVNSGFTDNKLSSDTHNAYNTSNIRSANTAYNQAQFTDNAQSINSLSKQSDLNTAVNTSNTAGAKANSGIFANVKDNKLNFSANASLNTASTSAVPSGLQKSSQSVLNSDNSVNNHSVNSYSDHSDQDPNILNQSKSQQRYASGLNETAATYSAPNDGSQQSYSKPPLTQNKAQREISASVYIAVFFRQLIASFFNFTNLGALFPKLSLSVLGPSVPAFMPLPYFVVGFITSTLGILMKTVCSSDLLCAIVVTMFFFTMTGSAAFKGIGHLCTAVSLRKLDTYGKILITIFFISLFAGSFEYFSTQMNIDIYFSLGIGVIFMLSSFTATTLNFGSSDDPVSSFGALGLKGLISGTVICLAVTFTVLDWQIALTMLGICLLCRVLVGQFMDIKGIKAGTDMVCGLQLITSVLLMLELIFTAGYFTFINSSITG